MNYIWNICFLSGNPCAEQPAGFGHARKQGRVSVVTVQVQLTYSTKRAASLQCGSSMVLGGSRKAPFMVFPLLSATSLEIHPSLQTFDFGLLLNTDMCFTDKTPAFWLWPQPFLSRAIGPPAPRPSPPACSPAAAGRSVARTWGSARPPAASPCSPAGCSATAGRCAQPSPAPPGPGCGPELRLSPHTSGGGTQRLSPRLASALHSTESASRNTSRQKAWQKYGNITEAISPPPPLCNVIKTKPPRPHYTPPE